MQLNKIFSVRNRKRSGVMIMSKFLEGQSGNPQGRPVGIPDRRTKLRALLHPHAEELVKKAVELALGGDVNALRLCIDRLIPKVKDESINTILPNSNLSNSNALIENNSAVLQAIAEGELTPEQGKVLTSILEIQQKMILNNDVVQRLDAIEKVLKSRSQ